MFASITRLYRCCIRHISISEYPELLLSLLSSCCPSPSQATPVASTQASAMGPKYVKPDEHDAATCVNAYVQYALSFARPQLRAVPAGRTYGQTSTASLQLNLQLFCAEHVTQMHTDEEEQ